MAPELISTTQALAPFSGYSSGSGAGVRPGVLLKAMERGTFVHKVCASIASGAFIIEPIPDDYKGYITSYRSWFELMVDRVIFVEKEFVAHNFGYVSHPDLGVFLKTGERALIDLKTPLAKRKVWAAQLASYKYVTEATLNFRWDKIGSLQLDPDGKMAKMVWYNESPKDFNAFLACLTATRYFLW